MKFLNFLKKNKKSKKDPIYSLESKYEVILSKLGNGKYDWSDIVIKGSDLQYTKEKSVITYIRVPLVEGLLKTIKEDKLITAFYVDKLEDAKIIYDFYKKNLGTAVDGIVFNSDVTGINDRLIGRCVK